MNNFINFTGHGINLFSPDSYIKDASNHLVLKANSEPIAIIEDSGSQLRLNVSLKDTADPYVKTRTSLLDQNTVTTLNQLKAGSKIIVSFQMAAPILAKFPHLKVYTVGETIRQDGVIVGASCLVRN